MKRLNWFLADGYWRIRILCMMQDTGYRMERANNRIHFSLEDSYVTSGQGCHQALQHQSH